MSFALCTGTRFFYGCLTAAGRTLDLIYNALDQHQQMILCPKIITYYGIFPPDFKQLVESVPCSSVRSLNPSGIIWWCCCCCCFGLGSTLERNIQGDIGCLLALDRPTPVTSHTMRRFPKTWTRLCLIVIPAAAGAPSPTKLFPSRQLSKNMFWHSALWTASLFSDDLLWLTLHAEGVGECLLDNCQGSSLP